MLISNRPIPKLGSALLLLGGCYSAQIAEVDGGGSGGGGADGGSGGGGGGGGGAVPPAEMIAKTYCDRIDECDPSYLAYAFGTVAACTEEVAYWLQYDAHYVAAYGAACVEAFFDYYECIVQDAIAGCYGGTLYDPLFTYDYAAFYACQDAALAACPALLGI